LPRPVASSNWVSSTGTVAPSAVSFNVGALIAVNPILIESPAQSIWSIATVSPDTSRLLPTGIGPRRTVARGQATGNRSPGWTTSGTPSITTSHSSEYQPAPSSVSGTSNGTNRSRCGATSSVTGSMAIDCDPPPDTSITRASSIRT